MLPIYTQQEQKNKYIDFELILLNSTEPIKLSNIVGKKIILLIFWTTWCPFCINEVPEVINLHETYKDKGLEIISINISEPQKIVSEFVKKKNIQYKVALDLNAEVAKRYYIRKIPTNFMIDINGKIVFKGHILPSKEEIEKYLSQLYPKKTGNVSTKKKQKKQKSKK
ncbi:MAG: TlpA disulfide reductase family protein [Endomicrobiia bacterium]